MPSAWGLVLGGVQGTAFYAAGLARQGAAQSLIDAIAAEAAAGATSGPYGRFPEGPLSAEDAPGPAYLVSCAGSAAVGPRLSEALAHAHLLVFHPRDAAAQLEVVLATPQGTGAGTAKHGHVGQCGAHCLAVARGRAAKNAKARISAHHRHVPD